MTNQTVKQWGLGVALALSLATTHAATVPDILAKDEIGTVKAQAAGRTLETLTAEEEAAKVAKQLATRELRLLEHYRDKLHAQLERLKTAEAGIETEREALRQVRLETGPLMDEMVASLKRLVAADQPFLSAERQARLAQLERVMADPTIDDGRRMDVLLDAYQVELTYGLTIGAENGTNEAGELVTYLRLGRLGYFAVNPNKETAMRYVDGRWVPVEDKDVALLLRARAVALGEMVPDVLLVPASVLPEAVTHQDTSLTEGQV